MDATKRIWQRSVGIAIEPRQNKTTGDYFWSYKFTRAFGSVDRRHDCVTTKDTKELREFDSGEVPTMVPSPLHARDLAESSLLADADLARLVAFWPRLPNAIKAGILAMVEVSQGNEP